MLSMDAMYKGIDDLENTYISKRFSLNDKQLNQWYKLLKCLTDAAYLEAVDEWCSTRNSLPAPADILEIAGRLRPIDNTVNIAKNREHCKHCGDTGFIKFSSPNSYLQHRYDYVACCVCEMGEQAKELYPFRQADKGKLEALFKAKESIFNPLACRESVETLVDKFSMN